MRFLAVTLLLLLGSAVAGPKGKVVDEVHPRSPDTPLKIVFQPYYCELCLRYWRREAGLGVRR